MNRPKIRRKNKKKDHKNSFGFEAKRTWRQKEQKMDEVADWNSNKKKTNLKRHKTQKSGRRQIKQ